MIFSRITFKNWICTNTSINTIVVCK